MVCPRQWQLSAISIWLKCVAYRLSEGRQRHTNNEIRQKGRTAAEEASWALAVRQSVPPVVCVILGLAGSKSKRNETI